MKPELSLSDILQVEDSAEVVGLCCPDTGIPLWTAIRPVFIQLIMSDLLYGAPIFGREGATGFSSRLRKMATIPRSFAYNALRLKALRQQYPIVLMATGARLVESDGCYFNCLSDYFVETAPNRTMTIEDLFDWKWPFPRIHNNVLLQTPLRVGGVVRGRLRAGAYREASSTLVNLVSSRATDLFGWQLDEERREWLAKVCMYGAASFLPRYQAYQKIFKMMGARLLIKEQGCYGGPDNASAILAARHIGMVTAEYQHGSVSSGHLAYNFSSAVSNSHAYKQTLPDYFLAYGSWWAEQINAPINKLVIGNPHRTETLDFATIAAGQNKSWRILVLGDGMETTFYLELCKRLSTLLGNNHEVIFRPHPLERASIWSQYPDGFIGNVRVDVHQDIYSSFREAGVVVSEVSTGLFEAIGLVPKVLIWNTAKARFSFPAHPFQSFSDADELARLVLDDSAGRSSTLELESVWAPSWRRNYLNFIEQVAR